MPLRKYQVDSIEAIRDHVRAGRRRVVLVSPTGSGKTSVGAEIVRASNAKGSHALWVAHRTVLVEQASERLTDEGISHNIAMGSSSTRTRGAITTVGSIQTLSKRSPERVDIAIIDEGHHAATESTYAKMLERYPNAVVLYLTATPREGMADVADALVVAATPAQLIAEGFLCNYSGFAFLAPDVSGVHTKKGDYVEAELGQVYARSTVFADVVEKWHQHAAGRSTIVFAAGIDNSLAMVDRFRAAGVSAEHLDYRSLPSDRHAIFERVRTGQTRVICNYSLLGEGLDLPMLKCVVLARPTKSWILATQMIGRGLRPHGGQDCVILDHAGVIQAHGLPDADRQYTLEAGPGPKLPALTTCAKCCAVWSRAALGSDCPVCHTPAPVTERDAGSGPDAIDAHREVDIREVVKLPSRARQVEAFRDLCFQAQRAGHRPGWAIHRFLQTFPGASKPWGVWREMVDKETKTWRSAT